MQPTLLAARYGPSSQWAQKIILTHFWALWYPHPAQLLTVDPLTVLQPLHLQAAILIRVGQRKLDSFWCSGTKMFWIEVAVGMRMDVFIERIEVAVGMRMCLRGLKSLWE